MATILYVGKSRLRQTLNGFLTPKIAIPDSGATILCYLEVGFQQEEQSRYVTYWECWMKPRDESTKEVGRS